MNGNAALDAIALQNDEKRGERLLVDVHKFLGRFISYPSKQSHVAHTLWIAHAHLMERWESTPRLALLSAEPASGKTRAIEVTETLVPNPVCAVNVSPAYLFRKVGSDEGVTILFDEIDTVFGPKAKENEEIRGLLNAGHRRGAVAGRCIMSGKTVMTEEISAYAAVALAGLGWLPDTILSRSVIIRMRRRRHGEQVEQFRHRLHAPQGFIIRDRLVTWARTIVGEINWPELPSEVQDRDADIWEPLIAIADLVGGNWPELARDAAVKLIAGARDQAEPSLGIKLLADTHLVFGENRAMGTKALLAALHGLDESPWGDLKGRPLDERGLARRLRQYDVKSKTVRLDDGSTPKGYTRADFSDAWERYLPSIGAKSATSATSATSLSNQRENVADNVADSLAPTQQKKSNEFRHVADVADVAELPGAGACCEQCCGNIDGSERLINGHILHRECERFWHQERPAS